MTVMMMYEGNGNSDGGKLEPSVLLVSDSEDRGGKLCRALEGAGFRVHCAGDYSRLEDALDGRRFDVVLLEVTGMHAVEAAVEAALRVKRARAGQFVGYLADGSLSASGLGGDGIFPRSASKLPAALRSHLSAENWSGR